MIELLSLLWKCIRGPRMIKTYQHDLSTVKLYEPNMLETWMTKLSNWMYICTIACYTITTVYLFVNLMLFGYTDSFDILTFVIANGAVAFLNISAHIMKGIGRLINPNYVSFCGVYFRKDIRKLRLFDYDFKRYPVIFNMKNRGRYFSWRELIKYNPYNLKYMCCPLLSLTNKCGPLNHICATNVVYPGSTLQCYKENEQAIESGRDNLVLKYHGIRAKLCTVDGNYIDTMHIDRRSSNIQKLGNTLVICCEGSDTYFENGIMHTPNIAEYSVLGWNAPGFGNSTGRPFPRQIKNAINVVIKYAIKVLRYKDNQIVLFGWNIGTYAATWGAVMYPSIHSLILDAPFDKLNELLKLTPYSPENICSYFDMNISDLLSQYQGPVHIIRRVYDEVMGTPNASDLSSNRTNYVAFNLIIKRYPQLKHEYYSGTLLECLKLEEEYRVLLELIHRHRATKECLSLVSTYMSDYKASHSFPLPTELLIRSIDDSVEEEPILQVIIV